MTQLRTRMVSEFTCLADKCEDTCCQHWSMQVDELTLERYKKEAPELLDAVEQDSDKAFIMRKDGQNGYCVKFEDGKCNIHKKYGELFLSDACNLYPRITRTTGDLQIMTATMSCPEIARLALYGNEPFTFDEAILARVPSEMKNLSQDGVSENDILEIHKIFLSAAADENAGVEKIFARIASVSRSLQRVEKKDWARAAGLYFRLADTSIPAAEKNINDPFNLLHSLCGLVVASKKNIPPRLQQTISDMEQALHVRLDWKNILIHTSDESAGAYNKMHALWKNEMQEDFKPLLKRWLNAQLSSALYPFAGLGENLTERITVIGVRLAILKLALISAYSIGNGQLHQYDVVRIVQSLSRFLDHLASPKFSLEIYGEAGWTKENRMLGLLD